MTAKSTLGFITAEKEVSLFGAGNGTELSLNLIENPDTSSLVRDVYEDTGIKSNVYDAGGGPSLGLRKGEISLVADLGGLATNNGGAVTSDNDLIASAFGTATGSTGTTVDDVAATTTVFDVASAAGLAAEKMVLVETTQGNKARMIQAVDTLELTVTPALPVAPETASDVIGSVTYTPNETRESWKVGIHKDSQKIGYYLQGVTFVPEISGIGAAEGKAKLTLKGNVGDYSNGASLIDSATPPDTFTEPAVSQDGGDFVLTDGVVSITCVASTFNFTGILETVRRASACKQNCQGAAEVVPSQNRQIEVELWQDKASDDPIDQLRTWFEAGTMLQCLYQVGKQPTDCLAFYFPACYIKADPKEGDKGGLMAIKVALKVSIDGNSAIFSKPFYFARF
jgi:hypothetical protein